MAVGRSSGSYADLGILAIRLGIGASMLILHGWGKITGGPETWTKVGGGMANLGIRFLPVFWGLMAALSESLGSVLLILGFFFRPAAACLAFTMLVAVAVHLNMPAGSPNGGWAGASHAMELMFVYLGLLLIGPGKYSFGPRWMR